MEADASDFSIASDLRTELQPLIWTIDSTSIFYWVTNVCHTESSSVYKYREAKIIYLLEIK